MEDEERILNSNQVAEILGVTPITIAKWLRWGYFPNAYRLNPMRTQSAWRIPMADVKTFIQKRREQRGYFRMPVASGISEQLTEQTGSRSGHRP